MQASQRTEAEKELREKLEDMKLELDTTRFELEEAQREIEDLDSFLKSSRPGTPTTPPPPYDARKSPNSHVVHPVPPFSSHNFISTHFISAHLVLRKVLTKHGTSAYTNEYTRLAIQTQLGNISDIKALAWTRTAYVPARDWIDRFIQIEDRLRKRVFELAKQHWPDLYAVLAPGGPSAVCFDHEHFARYHGLTDWTGAGLGLASREIQEALRGMVTVRNMNSHRKIYGPQSYSDGNYVLLLLWRCQEMACVLLDEDLAEEIHGLRERVERTALTFKVDTTQWW